MKCQASDTEELRGMGAAHSVFHSWVYFPGAALKDLDVFLGSIRAAAGRQQKVLCIAPREVLRGEQRVASPLKKPRTVPGMKNCQQNYDCEQQINLFCVELNSPGSSSRKT